MRKYVEVDVRAMSGRNFVVGDIHGCYTNLMNSLAAIGFDKSKDRLFSVGDLCDRGSENIQCLSLINEDWFYAVRGNHEDFVLKGLVDSRYEYYHRMANNGGAWLYNTDEATQQCCKVSIETLPFIMLVRTANASYGLVHADLPFDSWLENTNGLAMGIEMDGRSIEDHFMWSRQTIEDGVPRFISGVDQVFLGHTVLQKPVRLGNMNFIDTGAVFTGNLTIVELQ